MVEACFVLPPIFLVIMGVIEYGRYYMTLNTLDIAARDAARYAVAHTQDVYMGDPDNTSTPAVKYGCADTDVQAIFNKFTACSTAVPRAGVTFMQCYLSDDTGANLGNWRDAQPGQSICVRVQGDFNIAMPPFFLLPSSLPVDIKVIVKAEAS